MLLRNTGNKIVNIGKDILLPGEEKSYPKSLAESPALRTMIGFGFLRAIDEDKDKEVKKEVKAEAAVEESAEEQEDITGKSLRGRRGVKKAE